jgi:hypothetical protein
MRRSLTSLSLLVVLLIGAWVGRPDLRRALFDLTGEEDPPAQVRALGQLALNVVRKAPRLEPYRPIEHAGVNPFGVNTFLQHEVEEVKRERQVQMIAEAGFHWIRQEFPWEDIEIHAKGDFIDRRNDPVGIDAWQKYDHIVALAEEYDLEIIARLSSPPTWSRAAGDELGYFAPPDNFADYADFVRTVAERYRGRISAYQVWNEPNIYPEWGEQSVDPEAYTELLCLAYDAIKEADPDAIVLSGALAPTAELTGRDLNDYVFLQRMYDAGAADCFDVLSVQGYGLWSGPTDHRMKPIVVNYARNLYIRDIMLHNGDGDKAIWISEMNWNVAPQDVEPRYGRATLDQQARWAPIAYQRAQEEWPWVGVINFWYFKRASDDWESERRPEAYFRMLMPDFTPLPAYQSMTEYMHQAPVMYRGVHEADHWAVEWSDVEGGQRARFAFEGGRLSVLAEGEGQLTVRIDDGPPRQYPVTGREMVVWSSLSNRRHQVELVVAPSVVVTGLVVRPAPNPALLIVPALGLVAGLTAWRVRKARQR